LISIGAADMTIFLITAPLLLVLLANTTITLVLLTQKNLGNGLLVLPVSISMTNGGTVLVVLQT
jgi:hypothetical protein